MGIRLFTMKTCCCAVLLVLSIATTFVVEGGELQTQKVLAEQEKSVMESLDDSMDDVTEKQERRMDDDMMRFNKMELNYMLGVHQKSEESYDGAAKYAGATIAGKGTPATELDNQGKA